MLQWLRSSPQNDGCSSFTGVRATLALNALGSSALESTEQLLLVTGAVISTWVSAAVSLPPVLLQDRRIHYSLPTNAVHHARELLPFTSHKYTSGIFASLVLSNLGHLKIIEIWIRIFLSSCSTCLGGRGVKVQQGGKESSIQGKAFVYLGSNRKKYDLMPSVMYWKICGNQSGRNSQLFLNPLHSSTFSAFRICYSFMTCSSYTTCCKARKMSQDCDFCWERSFLCSVNSKSSKGNDIYYTHHTKSNTVHGWRQAHLGKILTNGSFPDMIPAPWVGQQGSLDSRESAHLKKESQIVKNKPRGAAQSGSCHSTPPNHANQPHSF